MWTASFWKDAGERAIKTAAQAAIVALSGAALDKIDYQQAGLAIASLTALSLLTSIVSSRVGSPADASLITTKEPDADVRH